MRFIQRGTSIRDQYIVVLQDALDTQEVSAFADELTYAYSAKIFATYQYALKGFAVRMTEDQARAVSADPAVKYVEENQVVTAIDTQTNPPWGLDRIDQRDLPLNNTYIYNATGAGTNAYVIDTGIRVTHTQFAGRATGDFTAINDGQGTNDCNGHGTHVSGTIGGSTYGVAKNVRLHAVRVLDCGGSGTTAGVISGIDWVTANAVQPAVANMSLGGGASQSLDDAVTRSVNSGVAYGVAAGNNNGDACLTSPARTPSAVTVAASTITDARASFSNYGTCVTLFAPGVGVLSSWATSDTATNTLDGTSMATPHVVGTMALFLERNPGSPPATVKQALIDNSTPNHISNPGPGTPNRLLYMAFIGGGSIPTTSITAPLNGDTVSGTITISASASDPTGIQRVEFYVDNSLVGTSTVAPYSTTWDTTTVPNGTHSITSKAYNPAGGVGTSAPVSVTVSNGSTGNLVNGDFETGTLIGWTPTGVASISTNAHGGLYSAQVGSTAPSTDSSIAQTFNLPVDAATLTFWYQVHCPDTITYDWATATLYDTVTATTLTLLAPTCTNTGTWVQVTTNVAAMAGHQVTLTLSNHDDNYPGDPTYTLYDDVSVATGGPPPPDPIVNGGFETGDFTGWGRSGVTSITSSSHTGLFAAQLGDTNPSGESSVSQTFTVPAAGGVLSIWYWIYCPDTITYDWATATVRDNVTSATVTMLPRTCTISSSWTQATANLASMAGHSVTLTLINHDDNYPGDATYTRYDDATLQ